MARVALHIGVFDDSHLWMKEAKNLGYEIVAIHRMDIKDKYYYHLVEQYIDHLYVVDYHNYDKIIEIARAHNISMTVTHPCTNDANLASAVVNSALNLKGIKKESAAKALSKYDFAVFLRENNFSRSKWNYKYNDLSLEQIRNLEYPCVVKPNFGAGSAGVKKIYSPEELIFFMKIKDKEEGYWLADKNDFYIVQEYVRAKYLIGANCAIKDGKLIIFAHYIKDMLCVNEQMRQPYFYYEEGLFSRDNNGITPETHRELQRCITELGIDNGAGRFDIFVDDDFNLVSIIELNLRPGSSNAATGYHRIFDNNITKELIKLNTDLSVDFSYGTNPEYNYLFCKNFRFKEGKIRRIEWPVWSKNVHHFSSTLKPGDTISSCWNASTAHMTGQLLLLGHTKESILQELDEITRSIIIEYE